MRMILIFFSNNRVMNLLYIVIRQMKLPQIQRILMQFEKQCQIMDVKEEMVNEAMDDIAGSEEDPDMERYYKLQ